MAVETSVDVQSNPQLDAAQSQRRDQAGTAFSFGGLSETRSQKLSLMGGLALRGSDGPGGDDVANGVVDPFLAMQYDRQARDASLSLAARFQETDLVQSGPGEFGGTFESGTAKRRSFGAEIDLKLRENARLGFGILAVVQKTDFVDGTAVGQGGQALSGTTRHRLDVRARLDLDAAHHVSATLGYRVFRQEAAPGSRESFHLDGIYQIDRPLGPFSVRMGYVRAEAGHRVSGAVDRVLALPNGKLHAGIGAARGATGGRYVTGHLDYKAAFGRGEFEARLRRKLASSDQDDSEQVNTAIALRYRIEGTPVDGIAVQIDWEEAKNPLSGLTTISRIFAISYVRSLSRRAQFTVGLRRRDLRDSVSGTGRSNEIFMSFTRKFSPRF
ncbi:hypothetical protein SAMN04488040_3208 [Sulfitobacter marinus]|uniref:Beta-barrel porin 2 n=1 Tax=Sulfitobacter marinus TaxID=394264 RepID=A0A1I6VC16_9RHOB|nr:hypothetical protein [Sulfitobacter marinus]SFT11217.1 hypothetical protein SAMN04488040_3208 [Sulfitobacter marinus]